MKRGSIAVMLLLVAVVASGCVHTTTSAEKTEPSPTRAAATLPEKPPVLGSWQAMDDPTAKPFSQGFGLVEPKRIDLGGDPTGILMNITWSSWGASRAAGSGTGYYDPPGVPTAGSYPAPATVVAFNIGTCNGIRMYEAMEWYYPAKGGSFDPATYWNICSREYVSPGQ